jgi:hypothetical protein
MMPIIFVKGAFFMRQHLVSIGFLLGLALPPPIFATSYSGSALLDLSTLSFAGIKVTAIPQTPPGSVGPQIQSAMASSTLDPLFPGHADACNGFCEGQWEDRTLTAIVPQRAASISTASSAVLSSSTSLIAGIPNSLGHAAGSRQGTLTANEAGFLTMKVGYKLMQSGVPSPITNFSSRGLASLFLSDLGPDASVVRNDDGFEAASGNVVRTGILSVTRFFGVGESRIFGVHTFADFNTSQAVPIPDTLWPTLIGMVGFFLLAERKRWR